MSLLWTQAMPWWNNEREYDHEGDDEYPLRDPQEPLRERGKRYRQQVMDKHGVTPEIAQKAIQRVVKGMDRGESWGDPVKYGFASSGHVPISNFVPPERSHKIFRGDTWNHLPVVPVDLSQPIHATQDFVRHSGIAHNLFHPGKIAPHGIDRGEGDPDYDPEWDHDDSTWDEPEETEHLKHPRFIRTNSGKLYAMDGHHRIATDLLLGKSHTMGRVLDQKDL